MPEQSAEVHSCDKELRTDPRFDMFRCEPNMFRCSCGQIWVHVCDEAEGCSYWRREDYADALRGLR